MPDLKSVSASILLTLCITITPTALGQRATQAPWEQMDYGPFLSSTVETPGPNQNFAYKGISIRLGEVDGETIAVTFDTDLLRYAVGWTGNFVQLKGVVFDGEHWAYPLVDGVPFFQTSMAPGASMDGAFTDDRDIRFGPLPRESAHYKGLYLHGDRVLFKYTVGNQSIVEMPSLVRKRKAWAFRRDLYLAPGTETLFLNICQTIEDATLDIVHSSGHQIARMQIGEEVIAAAIIGDANYKWPDTQTGRIAVEFPERSSKATNAAILLWRGAIAEFNDFENLVKNAAAPEDLTQYMQGGPPRWPDLLSTRGNVSDAGDAYVIDEIGVPEDNPWKSWMRFGGLDFFEDDTRAALSTWNGDVWIVSGIDDSLQDLKWQRIASGLFQPLGVKIVDGEILALGRDQITKLHDLNGDGEADYYENFNNDHQVSKHFHEFALDIQQAANGDIYYTKGARHARDAIFPQHGTLLKLDRNGETTEIIANGFRAPNGLGISPKGEFWISDNQGHWHPANRINIVQPGGFYGNRWSYVKNTNTEQYDQPLCWIHPSVDRSPGTFVWPPDDRWGPFKEKPITISYGMGHMFLVLEEEVGGIRQGGVVRFPLEFETGVMRAKFRPSDGQLYLAGLFGWAGNKTKAGGFYRVRYTGAPANMPEALEVGRDGVRIRFTDPVDPNSASNAGNYLVEAWNYVWSEEYGSPDFKFDGNEGRERFKVRWAALSPDKRTVYLKIPDLQPVMQLRVMANITFDGGKKVRHDIYTTVHKMGEWTLDDALDNQTHATTKQDEHADKFDTGLFRTISQNEQRDAAPVRTAALHVAKGNSVSPFVRPGEFDAVFEGFLEAEIREPYTFDLEGRGHATLSLNGKFVIKRADLEQNPKSASIMLAQGANAFRLEYHAPPSDDAALRIYWSAEQRNREPIPPTAFRYSARPRESEAAERLHNGRNFVMEFRCFRCHHAPELRSATAPELNWGAPDLAKAGAWTRQHWLADWIRDPREIRRDTTMPRLFNSSSTKDAIRAADIAAYLTTLSREKLPSPPLLPDRDRIAQGKHLYNALGCGSCHQLNGEKAEREAPRNNLSQVTSKWIRGGIAAYLRAPEEFHPGGRMPNFRLTKKESAALESYLRSNSKKPSRATEPKGSPENGRFLLETVGCLSCHDLPDHVNRATAPTFAELSQADWTEACLVTVGLRKDRVPAYAMDDDDGRAIREVLAHGVQALVQHAPIEFAAHQIERLNCNACHAIDGAADRWPKTDAPKNIFDDEVSIHATRPNLDIAGEKLRGEWIERLLNGSTTLHTRPHATARMPAFPTYAQPLAEGIAAMHGFPKYSQPLTFPNAAASKTGARLAAPDALHCGACHGLGQQPAAAGIDSETINFANIPHRLRPEFFQRFMMAPEQVLPLSMMPSYVDDKGRSVLVDVLDGDPTAQFQALWDYMLTLEAPAKN